MKKLMLMSLLLLLVVTTANAVEFKDNRGFYNTAYQLASDKCCEHLVGEGLPFANATQQRKNYGNCMEKEIVRFIQILKKATVE